LESAGVWLGLPLIGSGTLVLALAVLGRVSFLFSAGLQRTLLNNPATADFAHAVLLSLSGRTLQPMLWQGVALLSVGGFLFVVMALKKIIPQSSDNFPVTNMK
jgi:hypothetical protein